VRTPRRFGPIRLPRAVTLALATLLVAGCVAGSLSPVAVPVAAPAQTAKPGVVAESFSADLATTDDRIAAFEFVWHTVNDRFYESSFNGVDWEAVRLRYLPQLDRVRSDGGFYSLLGRMVGELRDSHTRIYTPREYRNRLESVTSTVGVRVAEVEGSIAIVEVVPDTPAVTAGLRPGMIVTAVNGEDARERLQRMTSEAPADASPERRQHNIYSRMLGTRSSAQLKLGVETPEGGREIALSRTEHEIPASVSYRILAGNIGFIAFNRFRSETAADFNRALTQLARTDSLIIDLRGNPGGSVDAMLTIAQNFFPEARHVLTRRLRMPDPALAPDGHSYVRQRSYVQINGNLRAYTRPLAVLVDGQTASSSELLATVLREQRDAHIVGRPSCGCVVAVRTNGYRLAGGGALYVAETGFVTPRGNRMEGAGIQPDSYVALTLADLRDGVDRDLMVAQQTLRAVSHQFAEEH
jgi:carboxyl-terminal processing protease